MIDLNEYQELKSKVEAAQRKADKATGALAQLMGQLKKEFGCGSVKEAKKLEAKLAEEGTRLEKEYKLALASFKEEWKDVLDKIED